MLGQRAQRRVGTPPVSLEVVVGANTPNAPNCAEVCSGGASQVRIEVGSY